MVEEDLVMDQEGSSLQFLKCHWQLMENNHPIMEFLNSISRFRFKHYSLSKNSLKYGQIIYDHN